MIGVEFILIALAVACIIVLSNNLPTSTMMFAGCITALIASIIGAIIISIGFFAQQPNQARVMIYFGVYRGSFSETGFYWVNPFMNRKKVSMRLRNMDIAPIKVNDKIGNPVMIGMVLVWKVENTYRAIFDVDAPAPQIVVGKGGTVTENGDRHGMALEAFVRIQSDAALREVTGQFAYDEVEGNTDETTLRGGGEIINNLLEKKINERLSMAGIEVVEARLNYLAYSPEIAAVMLRRQQAAAIISAREKIVEGAVSMVKMALNQLAEENVVELDEERKAAMVSNMLVVLCADEPAQPVLNTGSLYQ
ncbi:MAG: SPFH domain-containing protein [Muribaculaceae bacterium]